MEFDLCVRSRRTITPEGERPAAVLVSGGKIREVIEIDAEVEATRTLDFGDRVLMPGLVDTHVHVNEPGRTEWEGFLTATRAAAAGGITTIVDMPLNSIPPTVDPAALDAKRRAAADQAYVDVGFFGGAVPDNLGALRPLHDAGVFGFKSFLLPSGVDEFPPLSTEQLAVARAEIAAFDAILLVHAEDAATIDAAPSASGRHYADFVSSRPPSAEVRA